MLTWIRCEKGWLININKKSAYLAILAIALVSLLGCAPVREPEADLSLERSTVAGLEHPSGSLVIDVNIVGNARSESFVRAAMEQVSEIYQQCELSLAAEVKTWPEESSTELPLEQIYQLTRQYKQHAPTVFVIESTLENDVAFSYLPSLNRDVSGTAWISDRVSDSCFSWLVAHEIGHIALNSSEHHPSRRNVMNRFCSKNNNFNRSEFLPSWDKQQCALIRQYFKK